MDNLLLTSVLSMAGLALFFAMMLAVADKTFRVKEDPKIEEITALLPGVNCGACGALSCQDFASHIVRQGADPGKCRVVNKEELEKIVKISGTEAGDSYKKLPLIRCSAETDKKIPIAEYRGIATCAGANFVFGGGMQCQYGCLGEGDCTRVCPFDALHMKDGLPRVDVEKCTGCGKCVEACPRGIITLQEKRNEKLFYVACSSHDTGVRVRKVCGVGCIACKICEKLDPEGSFKVENNLSSEIFSKQNDMDKASQVAAKCPTKVIKEI
jgi:electron transport complex protein RnfB